MATAEDYRAFWADLGSRAHTGVVSELALPVRLRDYVQVTAFDPDYPTPAALAYRDGWLAGALAGGLHAIPEHLVSWAIDRAIQAGKPPKSAGLAFADTYFRVHMKPDYQDAQRRNGILKREAFLLSEYEKELRHGSGNLKA